LKLFNRGTHYLIRAIHYTITTAHFSAVQGLESFNAHLMQTIGSDQ